MYRRLRLCANNGGYETIPEPPARIDLAKARVALEREGVPFVDARVLLIARFEAEVTISAAGRLLIKTRQPQVADRTFERLRQLLGLSALESETEPKTSGRRN